MQQTPQAVQHCHELLLWMIPHLDKFPRIRRFTLGERLETRLLSVLENLVEAAYTRNKKTPLIQECQRTSGPDGIRPSKDISPLRRRMQMKFVNPKNDVAFKKIFGDEKHKRVLISFLNAILDLTGEKEIIEVDILNPYQTPHLELLKYTLLDVRAIDKRGVNFIVEMQNERVPGLRKRFQYYATKSYAQQIERGEEYPKLNQVIFIGILDFVEFTNQHYLGRHLLLNVETGIQELKDLEFNFIELPKFKKTESNLTTILDKWIYFIKNAADLDIIPLHADSIPLREAYEIADKFGWSKKDLEIYDYWSIKEQDERGAVELALETGLQQGIQQGDKNARLETARKMSKKGFSVEEICELTGLDLEDLSGLGNI